MVWTEKKRQSWNENDTNGIYCYFSLKNEKWKCDKVILWYRDKGKIIIDICRRCRRWLKNFFRNV